jgi:hypothetical protein
MRIDVNSVARDEVQSRLRHAQVKGSQSVDGT